MADLAAPLHHVRKDELASEEVRQHRRTMRIARGAVGLLALLTAAAVVAGLLAISARGTAQAQQRAAESSALSATSAADVTHTESSGVPGSGCSNLDTQLSFAADGTLVLNLGYAGPVYVWSPLLETTSPAALTRGICAIVGSSLSRSEYSAVLPGEPYHRTCA